jgi:hypothetical protein
VLRHPGSDSSDLLTEYMLLHRRLYHRPGQQLFDAAVESSSSERLSATMNIRPFLVVVGLTTSCILCGCSKPENKGNTASSPTNGVASLDPELKRLVEERLQVARSALEAEQKKLQFGKSTPEEVFRLRSLVIEAQLALTGAPQEEIPLREQQVALAAQMEQEVRKKVEVGAAAPSDELLPRYWRLTAECDLLKAKRRLNPK